MNRNAKNILAEKIQIPTWWAGKRIRDTSFGATSVGNADMLREKLVSG
jgi:hypothetical protein